MKTARFRLGSPKRAVAVAARSVHRETLCGLGHEAVHLVTPRSHDHEQQVGQRVGILRCRGAPGRFFGDVAEQGPRAVGFEPDVVAVAFGVRLLHRRQGGHELLVDFLAEDAGDAGLEHLGGDVGPQVHGIFLAAHEQLVGHSEHLARELPVREVADIVCAFAQIRQVLEELGHQRAPKLNRISL